MPRVGIALGSNLGNRLANLHAARNDLQDVARPDEPILTAHVYQTEPLHCPPGSPAFYNSAMEISFEGTALDLLEITQSIEKKLGRPPTTERNEPRIIDIDLLYFGDEIIDSENLVLPHPRIAERRFVLQPLADIRPDLVLPGQKQSVAKLLDALESTEPPLICVDEA